MRIRPPTHPSPGVECKDNERSPHPRTPPTEGNVRIERGFAPPPNPLPRRGMQG
ncbi:MAG: hypothetical protein LBP62_00450 [Clostridiales bacterium]|nr:hypothetical protein [Clostridiales bacterium]